MDDRAYYPSDDDGPRKFVTQPVAEIRQSRVRRHSKVKGYCWFVDKNLGSVGSNDEREFMAPTPTEKAIEQNAQGLEKRKALRLDRQRAFYFFGRTDRISSDLL